MMQESRDVGKEVCRKDRFRAGRIQDRRDIKGGFRIGGMQNNRERREEGKEGRRKRRDSGLEG